MNILHIIPDTGTDQGGLQFAATEAISSEVRQSKNKINVAVLSTTAEQEHNKLAKELSRYATLYRLNQEGDKTVQLKEIYRKIRPDIVVLWLPNHSIVPFLETIRVPLIFRASTVYDFSIMPAAAKQSYAECFRLVQEKGGLVICNSDPTKAWNSKHFGLPAECQKVIIEGIELKDQASETVMTKQSLGIPEDAYVVFNNTRITSSAGVPNYRKDPFGFILMASYLSRKYPDVVFVMCGNGAQWSSNFIQQLIHKANEITGGNLTHDNFKALGQTEHTDDVYKISDICVSVSQSEAFGRTVVEAMVHGVPSIVTNTGIMPEMNGDIPHVIPVRKFSYGNDESYYGDPADNLEWLSQVEKQFAFLYSRISDPEKIALDSRYLQERARTNYDMDTVARKYLETYGEVISAGRSEKKPNERTV